MSTAQKLFTPRVVVMVLVLIVLAPFLPLLIAGRWDWWEAWAVALAYIGSFVISRALAARRNPDLLVERARTLQQPDIAPWDKWLSPLIGVAGLLTLVAAGLNARLGAQPDYLPVVEVAALVGLLAGYALGGYALLANRFFSGVVRLQTDRGQQVVTSGPYAWLRHPGYAGAVLAYGVLPILLEAPWAWLPVALLTATLVVRTALEDRLLQAGLPGYREYAQRVRYRLLPGVW